MSRDKQGSKTGRRERHLARQAALKERKRLRKVRAARFAHLPGQQPKPRVSDFEIAGLELLTVKRLHAIATARGIEFRSKDRKAELIAKIVAES